MKEKTKNILIVTGLTAVGIALVIGIWMRQYKEEESFISPDLKPTTETQLVIETEEPETEASETEESKELDIQKETETQVKENEQEIQSDPVKTETEKPSEAPELEEDADTANPDTEPAYKEETTKPAENKTESDSATPKDGDRKDGKIYIEGFGWIEDEGGGGGGSGTDADDMYENGNKIGNMD